VITKTSDKRSDVLQAALDLIAERGFHNAPMAEIAEKAGVAAGTIYRYFESKDVLIAELYRELEDKINEALRTGYTVERPLRERFLYLIRELLRYFIAHPLHFRYMEQYFNSPHGASIHRDRLLGNASRHDIVTKIFAEGISRQILKDLPFLVLFALAFGPLISLMRDHILGFITLDETLIQKTTEACWDAIKR
jgi:TetR/AcrR family transcriptional regulator, repressor of fatR-cypB operon